MKIKVIFAILLLGVCLIEINNAYPTTDEKRDFLESALEYAQESLASVTKKLKDTFNSVLDELNKFAVKISKLKNEAITAVENELNDIINKANKEIDDIIKAGEEARVDNSDCLDKDKLAEMRDTLMENEKKCVTDEIDKIYTIMVDTKDIIYNTTIKLQNLPKQITECYQNSDIWGLKDVAYEVLTLGVSIPVQLTTKITAITNFVGGLQTRLEICAAIQVGKAGIDSAKIIADVWKCVNNKVYENLKF